MEIKNTTLLVGGAVRFPDAVTERGRKHLELLVLARRLGFRAAICFAVNRPEGRVFEPARDIDPLYAVSLQKAAASGVLIMAVRLRHSADAIEVQGCALAPGSDP